jgi:diguanylate cyclase (GGDEF)-like protein
VLLHGALMRDRRGRPVNFVGQIIDVTEHKHRVQTMQHMAYHDQLTGLPNRILFREKLALSLAKAKASQDMLAVIFLDLDRFKIINDTLGHYIGDLALKLIADRLIKSVRSSDVVARMGGDEFTVALPNVAHEQDVLKILGKMITSLEEPLLFDGREFIVSASVGMAMHPRDGQDVDALLRVADTAMYMSKRNKDMNY